MSLSVPIPPSDFISTEFLSIEIFISPKGVGTDASNQASLESSGAASYSEYPAFVGLTPAKYLPSRNSGLAPHEWQKLRPKGLPYIAVCCEPFSSGL